MASKKDSKMKDVLEKMGIYNKRYIEDADTAEQEHTDESFDASAGEYSGESYDSYSDSLESTLDPMPKYETSYGINEKIIDKSFWNDDADIGSEDHSSTFQYMDIEQLYKQFRLKPAGTDTIYLIEEYIKTLPDSLPVEMRRSIVLKIVNSSGFDFDKLLNDGIDRVSKLNEYSNSFAAHTEEIVSKHSAEIVSLEQQIDRIREIINERRNLHKRQFLTIENEAQRLKEILDFITK